MNALCQQILVEMLAAYKKDGTTTFDPTLYLGEKLPAIEELKRQGYVTIVPNIIQEIELTSKARNLCK